MITKNVLIGLIVSCIVIIGCKKKSDPTILLPTYYYFEGISPSAIISNDNNLIISGISNGNDSFLVYKVALNGSLIWKKKYIKINPNDKIKSIIQTYDGNYFITGYTFKYWSNSRTDPFIIKLNPTGDTIWTKYYGTTTEDYCYNIIKTIDNNILICGHTYISGMPDIFLLKLNLNGDTVWSKVYNNPDQEMAFGIKEAHDGSLIITGTNEEVNFTGRMLYLLKVDINGNKVWDKSIDPVWKWGEYSIELLNNNFLTGGYYTKNGYSTMLLIKTNNIGEVQWEKNYGEPNANTSASYMVLNNDGTTTVIGNRNIIGENSNKIFLLKIDNDGNEIWHSIFGDSGTSGEYIFSDVNNDFILVGEKAAKIFITKIKNDGSS